MPKIRPDRLITLGLVHPFLRLLHGIKGRPRERILPVLMYHSISDDPEPGVPPYYKICTSPARFADQMQWLADLGYRGVTLCEGLAWLNENGGRTRSARTQNQDSAPTGAPGKITEKLVAITFDDGFRDFHTEAFPVLQRIGFTATMYLPTGYIGDDRKTFKSRECLTWAETRELQAANMEFGSHTVSHPKLVELDWPDIASELRASQQTLHEQLHHPGRSFAYPYAFPQADPAFSQRFCELLTQVGYENCVTTAVGRVRPRDNPLLLRRLPVNGADDRALLRAKLHGAYDWFALPQKLRKKIGPRRQTEVGTK